MRALHIPRSHATLPAWRFHNKRPDPKVMEVLPQISTAISPTLTKPWFAGSGSNAYQLASHPVDGAFTFCRGLPDIQGPTLGFRPAATVTSSPGGARVPSGQQFSFYHEGDALELHFQNNDRGYLLKIDGEYVSLTPRVDSGQTFTLLDFGSRKLRRVDIITYKAAFAGVWTAPSDTVYAAPVRGPRTICVGDSFTEADATGWTNWFAESLGWDDVWTSGVGATGYVADANGGAVNWGDRVEQDVIAYKPDVVFLHGSVNDLSHPLSQVRDAVHSTVARIRTSLPRCVVAGGMNTPFGVEFWTPDILDVYDAVKESFEAAGGVWMSTLELPFGFSGEPIGTAASLMDPIAAGRPGNAGTPDTLNGGSGFRVNTSSQTPDTNLRIGSTVEIGSGPSRERVVITANALSGGRFIYAFDGSFRYAHAAGEPVREVAPSFLTGQGSQVDPTGWGNTDLYVGADGYHPSAAGNIALGQVNAAMLKRHLRLEGLAG